MVFRRPLLDNLGKGFPKDIPGSGHSIMGPQGRLMGSPFRNSGPGTRLPGEAAWWWPFAFLGESEDEWESPTVLAWDTITGLLLGLGGYWAHDSWLWSNLKTINSNHVMDTRRCLKSPGGGGSGIFYINGTYRNEQNSAQMGSHNSLKSSQECPFGSLAYCPKSQCLHWPYEGPGTKTSLDHKWAWSAHLMAPPS